MTSSRVAQGGLLDAYAAMHPQRFAEAVAPAGADAQDLLAGLSDESLRRVVACLPQLMAAELLEGAADETIIRWLSETPSHDAVRIFRRVEEQRRSRLLALLPRRRRNELARTAFFRPGTIGAVATLDFVSVQRDAAVPAAVDALRSRASDSAPVLVVDDEDRLVGRLDLALALTRGPQASVGDCLSPVRPLLASASVRVAVDAFANQPQPWLPVVDDARRLVGLLSASQLRRDRAEPSPGAREPLAEIAVAMFELLADLPGLLFDGRRDR
ncbi:MAG: CBS domain-containing protein [Gammaproteobacteria bacterium]|nr:CBS domain-containing protein [Gammaproteobacteria bacterium]